MSQDEDSQEGRHHRVIPTYDPVQDAAERWPGWTIQRTDRLKYAEKVICPDEQLILVNEKVDEGLGTAQAVAHLDLGHHEAKTGWLKRGDSEAAAGLAEVRLDEEHTRPREDDQPVDR
jgi:hypothetical protein